jgi:4-hydroxybenzoate polyprenyltransferase
MTTTAQAQPRLAAAIFDLSRGRQALLSVAQPALGALLALGALPSARTMVIGLVAATAGFLAVFSLNDLLDLRVDKMAAGLLRSAELEADPSYDLDTAFQRHPLAHGAMSLALAWTWVGGLGVVSVVSAFALGPACVACFAGAVALEVLYCGLRSVTWTKTLVSGAMVGLGGLAGWVAVAPLSLGAAAFFVFLALWEIVGRNLPNDLADYDDDSRVGLKTVSTVFGHATAGKAIFGGSILTVLSVMPLPLGPVAGLASLVVVVLLMVVPSVSLAEQPTSPAAAQYFNRASLVPAIMFAIALAVIVVGGR